LVTTYPHTTLRKAYLSSIWDQFDIKTEFQKSIIDQLSSGFIISVKSGTTFMGIHTREQGECNKLLNVIEQLLVNQMILFIYLLVSCLQKEQGLVACQTTNKIIIVRMVILDRRVRQCGVIMMNGKGIFYSGPARLRQGERERERERNEDEDR
jgi:branched-subunit amino acid transport protein AzlD